MIKRVPIVQQKPEPMAMCNGAMPKIPGLVLFHDYAHQQSGQYIVDKSGHGNVGQLGSTIGSDTNDPSWASGGLKFDTDDYVYVAASASLASRSGITAVSVAYPTGAGGNNQGRMLDKGKIGLYVNNVYGENTFFGYVSTVWKYSQMIGSPFSMNGWHLSVGIYDGKQFATWCDGFKTIGDIAPGQLDDHASTALYIGNRSAADRGWAGKIAATMIFNRALSDAEYLHLQAWLREYLKPKGVALP